MGAGRLFGCAVEVVEADSSLGTKKYTISAGDKATAMHTRLVNEGLNVEPLGEDGQIVLDLAKHDYFSDTPRQEGIITQLRTIAAARGLNA